MSGETFQVETSRLLLVGALTIAVSVTAVLAVREIAVRWLHPSPAFAPLTPGPPILDTTIATLIAIVVFAKFAYYPNPVRTWRRVASLALIASFIPDVLLAVYHGMGGGWPEAYALMAMHVAVWAICITLLPWLAFTRVVRETPKNPQPLSIL